MADPNFAAILTELQNHSRELASIRDGIAAQNSWSVFWGLHLTDLVMIFVADVFAAWVALVTFESWVERDRQNTDRAQRVLAKLSPHMGPLIRFLNARAMGPKQASTSYHAPWNESPMWDDLRGPCLVEGSLDWEYPGGGELSNAFQDLQRRILSAGQSMANGQPGAAELLESAQRVEALRTQQYERYCTGRTGQAWRRFFSWVWRPSLWRIASSRSNQER